MLRRIRFEEWMALALAGAYGVVVTAGLVDFALLSYFTIKGLQVLGVLVVLAAARSVWRSRRAGLAPAARAHAAASDVGGFVRDWIPWVVLVSVYENSLLLTARATNRVLDLEMFRLDEILFRGHVDQWLQQVTTTPLTIWVAFFYDSLYLYMVGVGGILYLLGRHAAFRRYLVSFLTAGYVGYALYFAFPVVGPYTFFDEIYVVDFEGARDGTRAALLRLEGADDPMHVFYDVARRISGKDYSDGAIPRNCFPSLHTAWGILILLHAFRASRRLGAILAVPVAIMIFGTVYLRFHYAIDLVAGAMLAWFVETVSPSLARIGAPAPPRPGDA